VAISPAAAQSFAQDYSLGAVDVRPSALKRPAEDPLETATSQKKERADAMHRSCLPGYTADASLYKTKRNYHQYLAGFSALETAQRRLRKSRRRLVFQSGPAARFLVIAAATGVTRAISAIASTLAMIAISEGSRAARARAGWMGPASLRRRSARIGSIPAERAGLRW
jgi:hypothetical protein